MSKESVRPVTILIAALGGEGGGVLMNWIVEAAHLARFPVQATSVPGVAQRTGATTYYIELMPGKADGNIPVMSLSPVQGEIDVMVSTELAEASRALAGGFISSDRTALIASTHRHYMNLEKMAMGEGRLSGDEVRAALEKSARSSVLFDAAELALENGVHVNAIMLGTIARTGLLGIDREHFIGAIGRSGKSVDANLKGFELGLTISDESELDLVDKKSVFLSGPDAVEDAVRRLEKYQNAKYAQKYRDRLAPFQAGDPVVAEAVARHLAIRMTYDDIIRVAQAKIGAGRLDRIRGEAGAQPGEPLYVTDFFKPGVQEVADLLPPRLARACLNWAAKKDRMHRVSWPLYIRTTTVFGFLKIWALAKLRWWRPRSFRWTFEQEEIDLWLAAIRQMGTLDVGAAREIAELSGLIKGYGATHARGMHSYNKILTALIDPVLTGEAPPRPRLAAQILEARLAALADPDGAALDACLEAD